MTAPMSTPDMPGAEGVKALSIMQPWSWLIVNGHNDVKQDGGLSESMRYERALIDHSCGMNSTPCWRSMSQTTRHNLSMPSSGTSRRKLSARQKSGSISIIAPRLDWLCTKHALGFEYMLRIARPAAKQLRRCSRLLSCNISRSQVRVRQRCVLAALYEYFLERLSYVDPTAPTTLRSGAGGERA